MPGRSRVPPARRGLRAVLVVMLLAAGVALTTSSPPDRSSSVRVPSATVLGSFDTDETPPPGWTVTPARAASGLRPTAPEAQDGPRALRVTGPEAGSALNLVREVGSTRGGDRYAVAALVRPLDGSQQLILTFLDASGAPVQRVTSTTPPTNTWTRTAVAGRAPGSATRVVVTIVAPPSSAAIWDDVLGLAPLPHDPGFESSSPLGVDWAVDARGGGSIRRSADAHSGSSAAELSVPAGHVVWLRSRLVAAFPGVAHRFGAWVRATEGAVVLTVEWYAADGRVVRSSRHQVAATARWGRVTADDLAPEGATAVSVGVSTTSDRATHAWVDDVTIDSAAARPPSPGAPTRLAELAGFVTTTTSQIATVAGRAQLMTVVSGQPATFQVFDLESGRRLVTRPLGGGTNGWALTKGTTDRDVYVGGGDGHVWHYDTTSQAFTDLGRATPEATLVWGLATDDEGVVWGASYPGGQLWRYDPSLRRFSTWGRVDPTAEYARGLAVDTDAVYVGTGSVRPHIVVVPRDGSPTRRIDPPVPMRQGFVKQLQRSGRFLLARFTSNITGVYDLRASRWVTLPGPPPVTPRAMPSTAPPDDSFYFVSGGRIWKIAGSGPQSARPVAIATAALDPARDSAVVPTTIAGRAGVWLVSFDGVDLVQAVELSSVRHVVSRPLTAAPVTRVRLEPLASSLRIKSLVADGDRIHLGGFGGPSFATVDRSGRFLFRYPTDLDALDVAIGEIEGMAVNDSRVYMGSYTGARILRYDPAQPWRAARNPVQVGSLGPSYLQDRPQAWAVDGSRTYFGTVPTYGVRGGAFGWVDGPDGAVVAVRTPVRDQSVTSIAGRDGIAYVGTSRWGGLGISPTTDGASVFAYDTKRRRMLWRTQPGSGVQSVGALVLTREGELYGLADGTLIQLDPGTGQRLRSFRLSTEPAPSVTTWSNSQLVQVGTTLYAAFRGGVYAINPQSLAVVAVTTSGASPNKLATDGQVLYYPSGSRLMVAAVRGPAGASARNG
ncbi:hypothetical protein [Terrabacter sp. MAHUQ-38]|uniref:hypothetical protein n=1 Tax=unclassified Terrabacter TaxID=2630222 RepID=UPI00165DE395|nr:hypothetical protein [Terrabacter sp. MAHUQ-38]MBC9821926.1 hypothetical protein [Terrabacter sp. MAHUQ-38]